MFDVGRWCVKIAGRDGGMRCVIVQKIDARTVLIDGQVRRKKCNVAHLEPLEKVSDIEEGASHERVVELFKREGLEIAQRKPKQKTDRPVFKRSTVKVKRPAAKK